MHLARRTLSMRTYRFEVRKEFRERTRRAVAYAKLTEQIPSTCYLLDPYNYSLRTVHSLFKVFSYRSP